MSDIAVSVNHHISKPIWHYAKRLEYVKLQFTTLIYMIVKGLSVFVFIFDYVAACTEPSFTCNNGQIVSVKYRCDDRPDCYDGSDEDGCGSLLL